MSNFTVQDLLGSLLAVGIFPLVSLTPGYAIGWALDIVDFRKRGRLARLLISILLSNAIVPVLAFLGIRYLPIAVVFGCIALCAIFFLGVEVVPSIRGWSAESLHQLTELEKAALIVGGIWIGFSLLLLLDIQVGPKLYFATTSYDYTTRIAVINAISRSGIPPVNPGYYPGHPALLTYLYYYWYIPASLVDQIGGGLVNSRHAMLAAEIWSGLGLMAAVAIYLRLRNRTRKGPAWYAPLIGVQLLMIGGMDVIPVLSIALGARRTVGNMVFNGMIEGWNMPIMSWLNAITWVPNHVSAAVQCITAMILLVTTFERGRRQRFFAATLAGVAFASALGSSVWVPLVFAIAWSAWAVILAVAKARRDMFWWMAYAGLIGVALSLPFIRDLLQPRDPGGGGSLSLPIALYIRPFIIPALLLPPQLQAIGNLLLLPLNYALELGFFFFAGLLWLQMHKRLPAPDSMFALGEVVLLTTVVLTLSFVYSNIIVINDLGIRGWLPGQFVLLVWATDLIQTWLGSRSPAPRAVLAASGTYPRAGRAIQTLLIIGLCTTALEAFATRMWPVLVDWNVAGFPNGLSPDTRLGSRTYNARLAYDFINRLSDDAIMQNNPRTVLDRPSGLYGTVRMAISDRTSYGVPKAEYDRMADGIAPIFNESLDWQQIDAVCRQYSIELIIVNDVDPVWRRLPMLEQGREAMYKNDYYAVFPCGSGLQAGSG